jgi:cytochrome c oxidase subunit 4
MSETHVSNTKRIWLVFGYLSFITIIEVILGIIKPATLTHHSLLGLNYLNYIFIILTVVKAYYIVYAFMHMEGEKSALRYAVIASFTFLVIYLMFILLVEGHYVFDVFKNSTIKWNF